MSELISIVMIVIMIILVGVILFLANLFIKGIPLIRQIGPTCGFYCTAYVVQRLKNNNKRPSSTSLHKAVYELLKKAECLRFNGRPFSYVGEIFDIHSLNKLVMEALPKGYTSNILKFDEDTFYKAQDCLYFIVPIQNTTPHFIVVEGMKKAGATVWDPNFFWNKTTFSLNVLLSKNANIDGSFDWQKYVLNQTRLNLDNLEISLAKRFTSLFFHDFLKLINSLGEACIDSNRDKSTFDTKVNLKGYIIGISKTESDGAEPFVIE